VIGYRNDVPTGCSLLPHWSPHSLPSLRAQRGNLVFYAFSREVFDVRGRCSVTLQLCSGLLHFVRNDVTLDCSHLPNLPPHFIAVIASPQDRKGLPTKHVALRLVFLNEGASPGATVMNLLLLINDCK